MYALIIILFIFGDVLHGLSVDDALKTAGCLVHCHQNESCQNNCNQNLPPAAVLTRLSMGANFNATLHCRDIDILTLAHNPGIFVIEQSTSNGNWNDANVHNSGRSTFSNLLAGTRYRYRVHRVNTDGISIPEMTEWFTTMKIEHQPQPINAIAVKNIVQQDVNCTHLKADIFFEPAPDRSCFYDIVLWADRNGLSTGHVNATNSFRFSLRDLEYDSNNTVIISARHRGISQHSNNVSLSFNTPSCLDFHKNLTICAPNKVDGLRVIYMHQLGTRGELVFTWTKPDFPPDKYTIQIFPLDGMKEPQLISVSGDSIKASYSIPDDVYNRYMISIVAESPGGMSPPTSIISTLNDHRINSSASDGIINTAPIEDTLIITFSIVIVIIAAIFICIYLKCKKKSKHKHQIKFCKNLKENADPCPSFEKSLKSTSDTEKKSESDFLMHKDDFEISPIDLTIQDILGSGITGVVRLGSLRVNDNKTINVAVKMLRDCPSADEIRCLQQEIMIMKSAGTHPNIVSMIGCCTFNIKPMLIVEYCNKGDLQNYLRIIWKNIMICADNKVYWKFVNEARHEDMNRPLITHWNREAVSNQLYDIEQDMLSQAKEIRAEDLLSFALQVANGMEYLSLNRIVHRDLAARNVLVCDDHIVKISDFGLSRDVYRENVYKKRGNEKLPLKWMALEALTHQIYTTQSDVWSFGILLWEIVTLGSNPYPAIPTNMILQFLKTGKRMGRPSNCGEELYNIMASCWRSSPRSRPTFTELKTSLDKLLLTVANHEYVNFSDIINESRESNKD